MKNEQLSLSQQSALARLQEEYRINPGAWFTSKELNAGIKTIESLKVRGLVRSRMYGVLEFQLKPKGTS